MEMVDFIFIIHFFRDKQKGVANKIRKICVLWQKF